jgi:hypothetical protein
LSLSERTAYGLLQAQHLKCGALNNGVTFPCTIRNFSSKVNTESVERQERGARGKSSAKCFSKSADVDAQKTFQLQYVKSSREGTDISFY